jgi:hypothetical protein
MLQLGRARRNMLHDAASANILHRIATQQRSQLQKTTAAFKGLHSLHTRMVPAMKEHFALSREARHWHWH